MPFEPSDRIKSLPTGIFADLAARKQAVARRGLRLIDLSVGSPDLPPAPFIRQVLADAVQDGAKYEYTLGAVPGFTEAVASFYRRRYGVTLDPGNEVLQLMGSQDGLAHLALALINPGDTVLVPDPGYPIYAASVEIAGGQLVPMPLRAEHGFLPQLDAIATDVAQRAKVMILNFPGNPIATLAPSWFFEQAIAFAKAHDILIVHDFAYSELVFDGLRAPSLLAYPGASDVVIEFNSLSKTFHMAGCRIGYAVGNRQALGYLRLLKSHIDYGVFRPIQEAAIAALTADADHLTEQVHTYERRRDTLIAGLAQAGWPVPTVHATMFIWAPIPAGFASSRAFALGLLESTGVVVTPGDAFGQEGEGYVRIALVEPESALREAGRRIAGYLNGR